jgi:hypothetical protein
VISFSLRIKSSDCDMFRRRASGGKPLICKNLYRALAIVPIAVSVSLPPRCKICSHAITPVLYAFASLPESLTRCSIRRDVHHYFVLAMPGMANRAATWIIGTGRVVGRFFV